MKNIFLALGPDEFLLAEFLEGYKKAAKEKYGEFSVDTFSFEGNSFAEIRNEIFSPAFFGGKRVIFLENFPPSATPKLTEKQKEQFSSLVKELETLPEDVVLICSNANPDKRTTLFKEIKKEAGKYFEHPEFDPKKDGYKFSEWIIARAKKYGSNISQKNADFLLHFSGTNLRKLNSELKKLSLYKIQSEILQKDIESLASPSEESGGDFAFSNALCEGNISKILEEFLSLSEKYDAAMIFNRDVLFSFRNLLKGKFTLESPHEESGISPHILSKMKKTLSLLPKEKLLVSHKALTEIDIMTKNGKLSLSGDTRLFLLEIEKIFHDLFVW